MSFPLRLGIPSIFVALAVATPLLTVGCAASGTKEGPSKTSKPAHVDAVAEVNGLT